jgi:hypothetical protein
VTPAQALAEPFPTWAKNPNCERFLVELSGVGPRKALDARSGKVSFGSVLLVRTVKSLRRGLRPARFPTNPDGLLGWGAHVKAGFARTHKYERPPLAIPSVPVVERKPVEERECFKVVASIAGRFYSLNSTQLTFSEGLTTRSGSGIACFASLADATRWLGDRTNYENLRHAGSPMVVLQCAVLGAHKLSGDGARVSGTAVRVNRVAAKVGKDFTKPRWVQSNKKAVNTSNKSRVVNDAPGLGMKTVNGEVFGYERATRGVTSRDFVDEKGHMKVRRERKGRRDNSFPRWWESGIKD